MPNEQIHLCNSENVRKHLEADCTAEEQARMEIHLNGCDRCRAELEELAGSVHWWNEVRATLTTDFNSYRTASIDFATTDSPPSDSNSSSAWTNQLLELLGPTDDPQMLGRLGTYEVQAVIGRGGTGIVLKAFDARLNRFVAIKVLSPAIAHNGTAIKRFEREGRAIAAVAHPHVVPVHNVDEYQGLPFIVMQLVSGDSLQRRIDRSGPLGTREVVRVGMQVAAGLSAAHAQGVVHRDIKPANVLLENGVERVLVTDFGLATVADDVAMTRTGVIAGTPQYMSPEQARGEPVDELSDLFSLGAVMYAAATGRPPFRAETVFGAIQSVCCGQPRSVRELAPETPEWLECFIMCLLSKSKERRFQSAEAVRILLSEELAHLQNPKSVAEPQRDWLVHSSPRRLPPMRAVAVSLVIAITLAVAAIFVPQTLTQRTVEPETEQFAVAGQPQRENAAAVEHHIEITGRVVDPSGNAVAAAELYVAPFAPVMHHTGVPKTRFTRPLKRNHILGRSDEDGRFAVNVPESKINQGLSFVAAAKGLGPAWVSLSDVGESNNVQLILAEDTQIRGRIIAGDGTPVSNATVRVRGVYQPSESTLDLWLDWAAKYAEDRFWIMTPRSILSVNSVAPSFVETDEDGAFTISGIGAERIAELVVEGPGIATETILVATHKGALPELPRGIYGVDAVHIASPGRRITGTVREKASGKPLSGATVICRNSECWTVTDEDGRYVLDGVPKRSRYRVGAGLLLPYFFSVEGTNDVAATELELDFILEKGIVLRGQVTDQETGIPVRSVIRYGVDPDQPTAELFPGLRDNFSEEYFTGGFVTDEDGRFEFAVAPTPGAVVVRPLCGNYPFALTPDGGEPSPHAQFRLGGAHVFYGDVAAVKTVSPTADQSLVVCNVSLPTGRSVQGTVVDQEGKGLKGTHVVGLNAIYDGRAQYLTTSTFSVGGLAPNRIRTIVFLNKERRLAGTLEVEYDAKGPLTAKLDALASFRVHIVDNNRQPLTQGIVRVRENRGQRKSLPFGFTDPMATGFRGFGHDEVFPDLTLNENGVVEFGGLISGLAYTISYHGVDGELTTLEKELRPVAGNLHDLGSIEARSRR